MDMDIDQHSEDSQVLKRVFPADSAATTTEMAIDPQPGTGYDFFGLETQNSNTEQLLQPSSLSHSHSQKENLLSNNEHPPPVSSPRGIPSNTNSEAAPLSRKMAKAVLPPSAKKQGTIPSTRPFPTNKTFPPYPNASQESFGAAVSQKSQSSSQLENPLSELSRPTALMYRPGVSPAQMAPRRHNTSPTKPTNHMFTFGTHTPAPVNGLFDESSQSQEKEKENATEPAEIQTVSVDVQTEPADVQTVPADVQTVPADFPAPSPSSPPQNPFQLGGSQDVPIELGPEPTQLATQIYDPVPEPVERHQRQNLKPPGQGRYRQVENTRPDIFAHAGPSRLEAQPMEPLDDPNQGSELPVFSDGMTLPSHYAEPPSTHIQEERAKSKKTPVAAVRKTPAVTNTKKTPAAKKTPTVSKNNRRTRKKAEEDEIIPDSEPPTADETPSTVKKTFRPLGSSDPQIDSGEIVNDSEGEPMDTDSILQDLEPKRASVGKKRELSNVVMPPPSVLKSRKSTSAPLNPKGKAKQTPTNSKAVTRQTRTSGSTSKKIQEIEMETVPSSVPDQDTDAGTFISTSPVKKSAKGKGKAPLSTRQTRSGVPVPKRQRVASGVVGGEDDDSEVDRDEYADPPDADISTRKRKRRTTAPASKVRVESSITLAHRRVSASSSSATGTSATRVFALWKQDGNYYPGTVYSPAIGGGYNINFDDESASPVNIEQMRKLSLRANDSVIVPDGKGGTRVAAVVRMEESTVFLRLEDDDTDEDSTEYEIASVRIASKVITRDFADRMIFARSIAFSDPSAAIAISSHSLTHPRGLLFSNTAFINTVSSQNPARSKDEIAHAVTKGGGVILDDWISVLTLEGTHFYGGASWVVEQDNVHWRGGPSLQRVFLLSDDAGGKPKYLLALALGVPCVNVQWIFDSMLQGEELPWPPYLLPQGTLESGARISQRIDLNWGNDLQHLVDIMKTPTPKSQVTSKVFAGLSVLFVGNEFVPIARVKKFDEVKANQPARFVPHIVLGMGAETVEAVSNVTQAQKSLNMYQYIVVSKGLQDRNVPAFTGRSVVDVQWIKGCLLANRLLPLPS